jgi:hypothetical protein
MAGAAITGVKSGLATLAVGLIIVFYYVFRFGDAALLFFSRDDFWVLWEAARIEPRSVADLAHFLRPGHNGFLLYRPLTTVAYFYVLRLVFGYDASGYHAVQLAAHVINALLVFGIARRLTGSRLGGLAAAVLYAAAPGHVGSVYWVASFTMTGTAMIVLAMAYVWLSSSGVARVIAITLLQCLGLLASEHAIVAPVLLTALARYSPNEGQKLSWRSLAPAYLLAAAYASLKLFYLVAVRPISPGEAYAPHSNPGSWLLNLGRYAAASVNVLDLMPLGEITLTGVGGAMMVAAGATWLWAHREPHCRLLALGAAWFIIALIPVLPLRAHFFAYFIGIAAAGSALAILGLCRLAAPAGWWRTLALAAATGVVLVDVSTGGRAGRDNPEFVLTTAAARWSAGWVAAVRDAAETGPGIRRVLLPREPLTEDVFALGNVHRLFGRMPAEVVLYTRVPQARPEDVVLAGPSPEVVPGERLVGWQRRWDWLRTLLARPTALNRR